MSVCCVRRGGFLCAVALLAQASLSPEVTAQQAVTYELPGLVVEGTPRKAPVRQKAESSTGVDPEDVIVSPTTLATASEQTASAVTVITGEQLRRTQQRTVADALRTVPGLSVVQTGGPGGQTAVFTRGTNANQTKVFIDGMDVGDASTPSGAVDLAHILTADVERIEVLRGPQGGLYGSGALGGVISIITKQGKGPPRITGFVEGGSFGTFNQALGVSGSKGPWTYAFNVTHFRSSDTPVTPLELLQAGQVRHNDFYDNWTYSTRLGLEVSKQLQLNVVARHTDANLRFTEGFGPLEDIQSSTDIRQTFLRGEAVVTLLDGAFKNYFGSTYSDQRRLNETPVGFNRPLYDGDHEKYDWKGVATVAPGQVVVMGLETRTDRLFAARSIDGFSAPVSAEQANHAGYVELQSQIGKRMLVVANARRDVNEDFGNATTWRLASSYILPGSETKLRASVGTSFRAPSLWELYNPFGSPDLRAERGIGYDLGFEQPLFNDKVRVGATYFYNEVKDLIGFDPNTFASINIDHVQISGVEIFASWAVAPNLALRTDYTYTDVDVLVGPVSYLRRRPQHKVGGSVQWAPTDALSLTTTLIYVGDRPDAGRFGGSVIAPSYTLVNLAVDYKLNETMTLYGRVDNLFDEQYQDPDGWLRPGLGVFGGIRFAMP